MKDKNTENSITDNTIDSRAGRIENRILPQFYYQDQLEAKYIREAGDKLWRLYQSEINRLMINQFILLADEKGIAAYEELFEILPDVTTEDLEFRRLRLINRNTTKPPFTLEYLENKLADLLGSKHYRVEMDYPNYVLTIEIGLDNVQLTDEIALTIDAIKPANIAEQINWIRQLEQKKIYLGSAIQSGVEMSIYPIFSDEYSAEKTIALLTYYKQGTYLSIYPKEREETYGNKSQQ